METGLSLLLTNLLPRGKWYERLMPAGPSSIEAEADDMSVVKVHYSFILNQVEKEEDQQLTKA